MIWPVYNTPSPKSRLVGLLDIYRQALRITLTVGTRASGGTPRRFRSTAIPGHLVQICNEVSGSARGSSDRPLYCAPAPADRANLTGVPSELHYPVRHCPTASYCVLGVGGVFSGKYTGWVPSMGPPRKAVSDSHAISLDRYAEVC